MSAPSPGQAAYEAFWRGSDKGTHQPWRELPDAGERWDAAAQAAITTHATAITAAVVPDGDPWLERAAEILAEGQP